MQMRNLLLGSTGAEVELLQERLKEFGFYTNDVSGEFDEYTETSVKDFQADRKLAVDGIVGLITRHHLDLQKPKQVSERI
jgi:N-acetylmuramoyl-L-alanine amidase